MGAAPGRPAHGAHTRRRHHDPAWLGERGRRVVAGTLGPQALPSEPYDIALIGFCDGDARTGVHRDSDEESDAHGGGVPEPRRHLRVPLR